MKKLQFKDYAPSLLSTIKQCYLCGSTHNIQVHHIYSGANRNKSSKYGCWVYLCRECHTGTNGVHLNYDKMLKLRKECQRAFEERYKDLEFIKIFGRNYD